VSGEWRWMSNNELINTNGPSGPYWGSDQPNGFVNEDCMTSYPGAEWQDASCPNNKAFVCELQP
jgi:hypothetical protein